jgi:hypothetical protein
MKTPEGRVKDRLKAYLKQIGAFYYMPVQTGYGAASIDFLVCHKGKFYGIETKRPGVDEPSPRQKCVMREIAKAGGGVWLENDEALNETRARLVL